MQQWQPCDDKVFGPACVCVCCSAWWMRTILRLTLKKRSRTRIRILSSAKKYIRNSLLLLRVCVCVFYFILKFNNFPFSQLVTLFLSVWRGYVCRRRASSFAKFASRHLFSFYLHFLILINQAFDWLLHFKLLFFLYFWKKVISLSCYEELAP